MVLGPRFVHKVRVRRPGVLLMPAGRVTRIRHHNDRMRRRRQSKVGEAAYWIGPSAKAGCSLKGDEVITLGIILLIIGFIANIAILWTIGIILVVVGLVLAALGMMGRAIGGRRHYY